MKKPWFDRIDLYRRQCLLFILFSPLVFSGPAYADSVDRYLSEGVSYLEKDELKSAAIQLKNALQIDPRNTSAHFHLGQVYLKNRDGELAEVEFKKAEQLGFEGTSILPLLARAYLLQGKTTELLAQIDTIPTMTKPQQAEVKALRGAAYMNTMNVKDAERLFTAAIELDPASIDANIGLARIALLNMQPDTAHKHVDRVLQYEPDSASALLIRGSLYGQQRDFVAAKKLFTRVLSLQPESMSAHIGLASALSALNERKEAQKHIDIIRENEPEQPSANYQRALFFYELQQFDIARGALDLALFRMPEHKPSHRLLGIIHYREARYEEAVENLEYYLNDNSRDLQAHKILAAAYLKLLRGQPALETLLKVSKAYPVDPQVFALLGTAYMQQQNYTKSMKYLRQALSISPDIAAIQTQLAMSQLASGNVDEAEQGLKEAVKLDQNIIHADILLIQLQLNNAEYDAALEAALALEKSIPNNPIPLNLAGTALIGKKDTEGARNYFEKALALDPEFHTASINLAQLEIQTGNLDLAKRHYTRILRQDENNLDAMMGMAELEKSQANISSTIQWLEKARDKNPAALPPRMSLLQYYLEKNEDEKALAIAREMHHAHPENPIAVKMAGITQQSTGLTSAAIDSFTHLTKLLPDSAEAYYLLAGAYTKHRNPAASKANLIKAIEVDNAYIPAKVTLTKMAIRSANYDEAMQHANNMHKAHPELPIAKELAGDIYAKQRMYKRAISEYKASQAMGESSARMVKIYNTYRRLGDEKIANNELESWLEKHQQDRKLRMILANAYHASGQYPPAAGHYEQLVQNGEPDVLAINNLAIVYQHLGDPRNLATAEQAYRLAPKKPSVMDTYGWILVQNGELEQGLAVLKEAMSMELHEQVIRYHVGVAQYKLGQYKNAKKTLNRVIHTDNDFSEAEHIRELINIINSKQKGN